MQLQKYLEISQADSKDAFRRLLVSFAHEMGFGLVSSVLVVERKGMDPSYLYVGNRPQAFEAVSADAELAKKDPVLTRLQENGFPFSYDQNFYLEHGAVELWEHAAQFGYKTGLSVAMRLPGNKQLLLGVDREAPLPQSEEAVTRLIADLQLLAVHCQDVAQRLHTPVQAPQELPKLTPRELEVLKWAMEGKSAWMTGQIMAVSENTVKFHLRNVLQKLAVSSKHMAVLKAISVGLI